MCLFAGAVWVVGWLVGGWLASSLLQVAELKKQLEEAALSNWTLTALDPQGGKVLKEVTADAELMRLRTELAELVSRPAPSSL